MKTRMAQAFIAGLLSVPLGLWIAAMFANRGDWLAPAGRVTR